MINPATWGVSLALAVAALAGALHFFFELKRSEQHAEVLRNALSEAEQEMLVLRRMAVGSPVLPLPKKPKLEPVSEKQIKQAIRDLRKWTKEDE